MAEVHRAYGWICKYWHNESWGACPMAGFCIFWDNSILCSVYVWSKKNLDTIWIQAHKTRCHTSLGKIKGPDYFHTYGSVLIWFSPLAARTSGSFWSLNQTYQTRYANWNIAGATIARTTDLHGCLCFGHNRRACRYSLTPLGMEWKPKQCFLATSVAEKLTRIATSGHV